MLANCFVHFPSAVEPLRKDDVVPRPERNRLVGCFDGYLALQDQASLLFVIVPRELRRLFLPPGSECLFNLDSPGGELFEKMGSQFILSLMRCARDLL